MTQLTSVLFQTPPTLPQPPKDQSTDLLINWTAKQFQQGIKHFLSGYFAYFSLLHNNRWQKTNTYSDPEVAARYTTLSPNELWESISGLPERFLALERIIQHYDIKPLKKLTLGAMDRLATLHLPVQAERYLITQINDFPDHTISERSIEGLIKNTRILYPPKGRVVPKLPREITTARIKDLTGQLNTIRQDLTRTNKSLCTTQAQWKAFAEHLVGLVHQMEDQIVELRKRLDKPQMPSRLPAIEHQLTQLLKTAPNGQTGASQRKIG